MLRYAGVKKNARFSHLDYRLFTRMKILHRIDKPLALSSGALLKLSAMIEEQLKKALVELKRGIDSADAGAIKTNMAFLDEALISEGKALDAQLQHYLKNRSYMKALAHLEGDSNIPKGRCGGKTDFS